MIIDSVSKLPNLFRGEKSSKYGPVEVANFVRDVKQVQRAYAPVMAQSARGYLSEDAPTPANTSLFVPLHIHALPRAHSSAFVASLIVSTVAAKARGISINSTGVATLRKMSDDELAMVVVKWLEGLFDAESDDEELTTLIGMLVLYVLRRFMDWFGGAYLLDSDKNEDFNAAVASIVVKAESASGFKLDRLGSSATVSQAELSQTIALVELKLDDAITFSKAVANFPCYVSSATTINAGQSIRFL